MDLVMYENLWEYLERIKITFEDRGSWINCLILSFNIDSDLEIYVHTLTSHKYIVTQPNSPEYHTIYYYFK